MIIEIVLDWKCHVSYESIAFVSERKFNEFILRYDDVTTNKTRFGTIFLGKSNLWVLVDCTVSNRWQRFFTDDTPDECWDSTPIYSSNAFYYFNHEYFLFDFRLFLLGPESILRRDGLPFDDHLFASIFKRVFRLDDFYDTSLLNIHFLFGLFYLGYRSRVSIDPRFFEYFLSVHGFRYCYVFSITSFYTYYKSFSWLFDFFSSDYVTEGSPFFVQFSDYIFNRFGFNILLFFKKPMLDAATSKGESFAHTELSLLDEEEPFSREIRRQIPSKKGSQSKDGRSVTSIFYDELSVTYRHCFQNDTFSFYTKFVERVIKPSLHTYFDALDFHVSSLLSNTIHFNTYQFSFILRRILIAAFAFMRESDKPVYCTSIEGLDSSYEYTKFIFDHKKDFSFVYISFDSVKDMLGEKQQKVLRKQLRNHIYYHKKLYCVCVLVHCDSYALSLSEFHLPYEFTNNFIFRVERFCLSRDPSLSLFVLDFVLEDVAMRHQNRYLGTYFEDRKSVTQYGYYIVSRLGCMGVESKSVSNRSGLHQVYCLNRLYSHAGNFIGLPVIRYNFLLPVGKAFVLSPYLDVYDYFLFITCEHSFYEYLSLYLNLCGFSYIRFSYFMDLFSSLYLFGFSLYQRIVFLDFFRVICIFRFFVNDLINSSSCSSFLASFDFSLSSIIDFCVSFFVSLYSHPAFIHLFCNHTFSFGSTREGCVAAITDVCLQFFNTCVYASDSIWIKFYDTFLHHESVCRFFKSFSLFNFYFNNSCADSSLNRKFRSRWSFYKTTRCYFNACFTYYPSSYLYLHSRFTYSSDYRYESFNDIYCHKSLLKRFVSIFSGFFVGDSDWGSYDFSSFDFLDLSYLNLFRFLMIIVSESSFFTFAQSCVMTRFDTVASSQRFNNFFRFLHHFLEYSHFYSPSSLNAKHIGLNSSSHILLSRRQIYTRKRGSVPKRKFPLCTDLFETKSFKTLPRKYVYRCRKPPKERVWCRLWHHINSYEGGASFRTQKTSNFDVF